MNRGLHRGHARVLGFETTAGRPNDLFKTLRGRTTTAAGRTYVSREIRVRGGALRGLKPQTRGRLVRGRVDTLLTGQGQRTLVTTMKSVELLMEDAARRVSHARRRKRTALLRVFAGMRLVRIHANGTPSLHVTVVVLMRRAAIRQPIAECAPNGGRAGEKMVFSDAVASLLEAGGTRIAAGGKTPGRVSKAHKRRQSNLLSYTLARETIDALRAPAIGIVIGHEVVRVRIAFLLKTTRPLGLGRPLAGAPCGLVRRNLGLR